MSPHTIVCRHEAVAWRQVGRELVLLQPETERITGLNETGAEAWTLLDGQASIAAIASELALRHGQDPARVLDDVCFLLADLERRQLVRKVD